MQAAPAAQFTIDLTTHNLTYTLEQQTDGLRKLIFQRRQNIVNEVITYSVTFQNVSAFVVVGHIPLAPKKKDAASNNYHAATASYSGTSILTVSINSLYPSVMGYANINNKVQQCYYTYINNAPYTMVGVNYQSSVNPMRDQFTVLIIEQVRFNTLKLFNKYFKNTESFQATNLFRILWKNFETSYKSWDNQRESTYIDVIFKQQLKVDQNKVPFLKAFLVEKLLMIRRV